MIPLLFKLLKFIMKKKSVVFLATCVLAFGQVHAGSIYGITADGDKDEFRIGDVRSP